MSEYPMDGGREALDTTNPRRYRASRRVTRTGLAVNVGLSALQISLGWVGRSQALMADGIHTLSDTVTDLMVWFALKHGARGADAEHPYGHGRIETVVTALLGALLMAVAVGIAVNAGLRLADPATLPVPRWYTLLAVVATLIGKEGLYRYTLRVAERYGSSLLRANAWHHRSDAISSLIVLVGIGGSLAGFSNLDALAAVGVAMMVARIGGRLAWQAAEELVDTGLDAQVIARMEKLILGVDGVTSLHLLRTRRLAEQAFADVHIIVNGEVSVSEGHHISENVRVLLVHEIESLSDVTVHIDPEDDERYALSLGLPLRKEMLERLSACFTGIDEAGHIDRVVLHYLDGQVHVDLMLPLAAASGEGAREALVRRLREAAGQDPAIGRLAVYFHAAP